jgi:hypothetical protein
MAASSNHQQPQTAAGTNTHLAASRAAAAPPAAAARRRHAVGGAAEAPCRLPARQVEQQGQRAKQVGPVEVLRQGHLCQARVGFCVCPCRDVLCVWHRSAMRQLASPTNSQALRGGCPTATLQAHAPTHLVARAAKRRPHHAAQQCWEERHQAPQHSGQRVVAPAAGEHQRHLSAQRQAARRKQEGVAWIVCACWLLLVVVVACVGRCGLLLHAKPGAFMSAWAAGMQAGTPPPPHTQRARLIPCDALTQRQCNQQARRHTCGQHQLVPAPVRHGQQQV